MKVLPKLHVEQEQHISSKTLDLGGGDIEKRDFCLVNLVGYIELLCSFMRSQQIAYQTSFDHMPTLNHPVMTT